MGVVLALIHVVDTNLNPLKVSYRCLTWLFTTTVIKSSCTRATRQSFSVIKVGVVYMNVHVSRHLKEELAWVINKWLRVISNKMLFKAAVPPII